MWILSLHIVTLLCCVSTVGSQNEIKYPNDADVYIGGFFTVYVPQSGECSNGIDHASIEEFEAARWTLNILNENNFLPGGLKLGIHVMKTCGIPEKTAAAVMALTQYYNQPKSPLLFGMLSPARSSEAKVVSRIISYLPENDRLLMLSYGATSSQLNNRKIYKNFFRIIPPDSEQVMVMLQLMLQLDWNYIGIIYEDDDYGIDAAHTLRLLAQNNSICVPTFLSFNTSLTGENKDQFFKEIDDDEISGIVYIGTGSSLSWLLKGLQELSDDIEIIVSESLKLRKTFFVREGIGSNFKIANGALATSVQKVNMQEFADHWKNIIQSNHSDGSWIDIARQSVPDNVEQSVYVYYIIKAVSILANLFKKVHEQECQNMTTICTQLYNLPKQRYIDVMGALQIDLVEKLPYIFQSSKSNMSEMVSFDTNREITTVASSGVSEYDVYNFQRCQSNQDFCFKKVGELKNGSLRVNKSLISMYDINTNQPYDTLPVAQCPSQTNCPKCLQSDLQDDVIFVKGDWYIIGVVPIFTNSENNVLSCGSELRQVVGTDIAESIMFAVENINKPNGSFVEIMKGSKIGLIVINDCETKLVIRDKITRLHKGTYELRPGFMSSQIKHKILGYVGTQGSATSMVIAETLAELGYIQVSYASTNPRLSNRETYPYFLRIPTSDELQARVVMDVVASLGANYIQLIYSEDSYGVSALAALLSIGKARGVCIAQSIKIPLAPVQLSVYNIILPNLRKQPHAKLVVTFIRTYDLKNVVSKIIQDMVESDGFIFIGSETWGSRTSIIELAQNKNLLGSISISLKLPSIPEFDQYMADRDIDEPSDPWLRQFLESRGKCIFPGSFLRKGKSDTCSTATSEHDLWVPFAVAATYSVVIGARNVISSSSCNSIDTNCPQRDPGLLAQYMKENVKLADSKGVLRRVFNDNGDGVVDYTLLQIIRKNQDNLQYTTIGNWSYMKGIELVSSAIKVPVSEFSSSCQTEFECERCFDEGVTPSSLNGTSNIETDSYKPAVYVLICVTVVLVIACVILTVKYCMLKQSIYNDPYYVDPSTIQIENPDRVSHATSYLTAACVDCEEIKGFEMSPEPCRVMPSQVSNQVNSKDRLENNDKTLISENQTSNIELSNMDHNNYIFITD